MEHSTFNPFSLFDKAILVTGASSGIGQAIAIACSQMGAKIVITARDQAKLRETLDRMSGSDHILLPADLTVQDDINSLIKKMPKLDGVVQCAGIGDRTLCKNMTANDIEKVFKSNVKAPFLLQSQLLQQKKINKLASIVFIASKAVDFPSIGNSLYSASKGAILAYSKCLALELAPRQIRVNSICPAMVWTDLIIQNGISKKELEEAQLKYPLKRYGKPEDIAYLAVYLLSNASSWMTGSAIEITGGGKEL